MKELKDLLNTIAENVKYRIRYEPEVKKMIRKAQTIMIEIAKMDIRARCVVTLHKGFEALSNAYYAIKFYEDDDIELALKVVRKEVKNVEKLLKDLNEETCTA